LSLAQSDSIATLLLAGLQAEEQAFHDFRTTLQAEQQALIAGDIAALTAISTSKLKQVEHLNRLAAQRLERIVTLGLTADRNGMEKWAAQTGTAAVEAWHSMLAVAGEAHQANQINGTLIQNRLQTNQQMMSALLAASNQANLYGPDGQPKNTPPGGSSRGIIGKA
jgi:flagellar biosynthesis/type III secretory pathway chaperone